MACMQADITTWSDAAITQDNGYALPDKPITVFYRFVCKVSGLGVEVEKAFGCVDAGVQGLW